jgi:hypothetical protein
MLTFLFDNAQSQYQHIVTNRYLNYIDMLEKILCLSFATFAKLTISLLPKSLNLPLVIFISDSSSNRAPEYKHFLYSEPRLRKCQSVQQNFAQMYNISKNFFILYDEC